VKTYQKIISLVLAPGLAAGASLLAADTPAPAVAAPQPPAVTLHVGDPAPALQYKEWIKGTEVKEFQKGQVYVVEFWATWCGWCKFSMCHLSEMAKKYDGKVTFVSMDVWEHPAKKGDPYPYSKVESFVTHAHDVMAYNIAADTEDGYMTKNWLQAAGQNGIPASFLIDQDGKIAWMGHPALGLEQAIPLVLAHKLDKAAAERITENGNNQAGQVRGLLMAMNEALKDPTQSKTAIYCADQVIKTNTLWNFEAIPGKYMALLANDPAAAQAYAESAIGDPMNGPAILIALASKIGDKANPRANYALAKEALDAAMKNSDPEDSSFFATRARISFKNGDVAQAVALEKKILESTEEQYADLRKNPPTYLTPERIDEISKKAITAVQDTLKEYEAGLQAGS
jgi:thiol-disulfide isomerase/thioredoxin